ncbi:wax ester/triacylglycerol synthase domain-containing protein [Catenulispora yoronensis]
MLYHDRSMRIGLVLHLAGQAPPLKRLIDHVRERLGQSPALSLTLVGRGTSAVWHLQPPNLEDHLGVREVPEGTNIHEVVRNLHQEPFADGRPPWTMTLVQGYSPGRYALVYRISHGIQDTGGMARTLEILFATAPVPAAASSATVRGLITPPRPTLRHRTYAVRLLAHSTAKSGLWPHPDHGYSDQWAYQWTEVPTDSLRSLAAPHHGSANDAFLATMTRAVSHWAAHGHPRHSGPGMPVTMAINLRSPALADTPGNHVTTGRFTLPGHTEPLSRTLQMAVAATTPLKQPPYREAIRRTFDSIPPWLIQASFRTLLSPKRAAACSSHFAIRHPLAYNGDPVQAIDPITALPAGAPVSALMISYEGASRAVFVTDSALPGMDRIHQVWRAEVEERPVLAQH